MKCQLIVLLLAAGGAGQFASAAEAVVLATGDASQRPQQPQLAVEPSGTIHVAFGRGNTVLYCRSDDAGSTFSQPVELPGTYVLSLGKRRGPRIAASEGSVCISFIGGREGRGRDGDVLVCRSEDGGRSWSAPARVNDVANSAREGLHAMATGPRGEMSCTWLDLRSGKTEIYAATSRDGGLTWEQNVRVYRSPAGSVCECCHPSAAYDATGKLYVMWRNSLAGERDMYLASSVDGGQTFGKAIKLGEGTWPLDACPMDGGYLAISPAGEVFTAWRRDREVYLTVPQQAERRLGAGRQPWIAATGQGPYAVWLEDRTSRLLLQMPGSTEPATLDRDAGDPIIAAPPSGQGPVVVAWERQRGSVAEVVCQAFVQ
jgi:photosystem II stability/assembly factor-like uncharacterized protein